VTERSLVSDGVRTRVRGWAVPVALALGRIGLTPNALTMIGFAGTCVAAWAAATQAWMLAGILVLAFGIFDLFDGTLARATGRASKFGAFLDSTLDRAGEAIVYVGIAAGSLQGAHPQDAILAGAALGSSFLVSYTRAKAESLGLASGTGLANVGFAPREVRIVILAVGLVLAPQVMGGMLGSAGLSGPLGLIIILSVITIVQRTIHVKQQLQQQENS
jgi:CDP-diacylglycerol---glycerol-3-phosphate 3-phosphatidyltransferase